MCTGEAVFYHSLRADLGKLWEKIGDRVAMMRTPNIGYMRFNYENNVLTVFFDIPDKQITKLLLDCYAPCYPAMAVKLLWQLTRLQ